MNLDDIFRPRARVNIFTSERIGNPRCVARVESIRPDGVTLSFDVDDLREAEIGEGDLIQMGFGVAELGMHYTCDTTIRAIEGSRVMVAYPQPPQKRPRRSHARAPLSWPCTLEVSRGSQSAALDGVTLNVSASGALIVLEQEPPRGLTGDGSSARLTLSPPDRPPLSCGAEIVRLSVPGVAGRARPLIAVRYLDLPEVDEMKLQLMVLRAIARRHLRCRVKVPCRLIVGEGAGQVVVEGVTENLSGSGLLLMVAKPPGPLRRRLRGALHIRLAEGQTVVEVAEITRVEPRGEDGVALALAYSHVARVERDAIIEFVMQRVRDV